MPTEIARALRRMVPALATVDDGRAELLAVVWGPRFDREQARRLAAAHPAAVLDDAAWQAAADRFDTLRPHQQQRLRRRIVEAPDHAWPADWPTGWGAEWPVHNGSPCHASC
jgi:hypothetical protein